MKVNFDPNKPQHHNVYYPDIKSTYGEVFEDQQWTKKKINEILNTLIDAKREDLNNILNEMSELFNEETINKIKRVLKNTDYTRLDCRKKLMSYLKPILCNKKGIVEKTRNMMTNNKHNKSPKKITENNSENESENDSGNESENDSKNYSENDSEND